MDALYLHTLLAFTLGILVYCDLIIIDVCTNPCQNGGTCTVSDTCTCVTGWIGMQCETGTLQSAYNLHMLL